MCISNEMMAEIQNTLVQFGEGSINLLPILKDCFPELVFVKMSDSDMDEPPYFTVQDYSLYLLDGREHCVQLTQDLAHATAVVLTQKAS